MRSGRLNKNCGVSGFIGEVVCNRDAQEFVADHAVNFAADFVGVAVGIELLLDVGSFGPFPEEAIEFGFAAGFFERETFAFDGEAFGGEVCSDVSVGGAGATPTVEAHEAAGLI
jgi:hypothetical protein